MKEFITSPWTLWLCATACVGIGGAISVGVGEGFFMAAVGLAVAAFFAIPNKYF